MVWSEQQLDDVRDMYLQGMSMTQVSQAMNARYHVCLSRSAISGAIGRIRKRTHMEYHRTKSPCQARVVKLRTEFNRPVARPRPLARPPPKLKQPEFVPIAPEPIEPNPEGVTIYELTAHTCKWPLGSDGPPFFYCGKATAFHSPWCLYHTALAWRADDRKH